MRWFAAIVLIGALALPSRSSACAACSNPNLPMGNSEHLLQPPRSLSLGMTYVGTYVSTGHEEHCPDINGPGCAAMPVEPEWHNIGIFLSELRLQGSYGITSWLAGELLWGLRITAIDFQLENLARQPIAPPYGAEIHHRSETIIGPTDPWLLLRTGVRISAFTLSARAGLTIPIASTVENPFARGRAGLSHQHLQYGTGTVDPLLGGNLQYGVGKLTLDGWTLSKISLYENGHGYRAGNQIMGGVRASYAIPSWTFAGGTFVYEESAECWAGRVETEGNLGRTDLMLELSIGRQIASTWMLGLGVRFPVWTQSTGAQLLTPAFGEITLTKLIGFGS